MRMGGGGGGGCAGVVGGWRHGCARCGGDLEAGRRDCSLAGMAVGRAVFGAKGDGKKRFCGDSGREDGGGVFGVAGRMMGGTETLWKRDVLGSWGLGHRLDGRCLQGRGWCLDMWFVQRRWAAGVCSDAVNVLEGVVGGEWERS